MEYSPDDWVILKVSLATRDRTFTQLRVLGGWHGGYLDGDAWRINSGIQTVHADDRAYRFLGRSGSVYLCRRGGYRMSRIMAAGLTELKRQQSVVDAEVLEDRNWLEPGLFEALLSTAADDTAEK
ncbi:hypothetical protein [Salipiger aestuarii]|uniref:hypothetical protein n=1 Tax=Salipiger aestuarii TaxID=568098 RepID=UPI001238DE33|nr:hypothetical protein [Salipiger aestuarii]